MAEDRRPATHAKMPTRTLGKTELSVSALALGTVELGVDYGIVVPGHFGRPAEADAVSLVHQALDVGINFIDTARAYGTSEQVLGSALRGRRDQIVLATKVVTQGPGGTHLTGGELRRHMRDSLDESLRLLQTDYVDIWQVHNVDRGTLDNIEVVGEIFEEAKQAGKIRFGGGSFYGAELPQLALDTGLFEVMQITYSILDQRLADHFFPAAAEAGVGIVARSVLLKGALTERAEHLPDHLEPLRLRARSLAALIADAHLDATQAQAAIAFAMAQSAIHSVLIGVRTADELAANLAALTVDLSPSLLANLASLRLDDADLLNPSTWGIP